MLRSGVDSSKWQSESVGAVALILALVLMIVPIEGGVLWLLARQGRDVLFCVVWIACFLLVLVLFAISWRRLRRYPGRWRRGRENLWITGAILLLNILFPLVGLLYRVI